MHRKVRIGTSLILALTGLTAMPGTVHSGALLNDLWRFDVVQLKWQQSVPQNAPPPPARVQVAGTSKAPNGTYVACIWEVDKYGNTRLFIQPDDKYNTATGINKGGNAVGTYYNAMEKGWGFFWKSKTRDSKYYDSSLIADIQSSNGQAINQSDRVLGEYRTKTGTGVFISNEQQESGKEGSEQAALTFIDPPADAHYIFARGINNNGDVCGYYLENDVITQPYYYDFQQGKIVQLVNNTNSKKYYYANGINDARTVVGYYLEGSKNCAYRWTPPGGLLVLGSLGDGSSDYAWGVNNWEWVVGSSRTATGYRAFLWTPKAGTLDLNSLVQDLPAGLTLTKARTVDDYGVITGDASDGMTFVIIPPTGNALTGPLLLLLLQGGD